MTDAQVHKWNQQAASYERLMANLEGKLSALKIEAEAAGYTYMGRGRGFQKADRQFVTVSVETKQRLIEQFGLSESDFAEGD